MPVNGISRKYYTDLVKGIETASEDTAIQFNFATVGVVGSGAVDNVGIPLIWNGTNFEVYVAQDIAAVTGSPLPAGNPVCLSVGSATGLFNKADTVLSGTPVNMTALHAGKAGVVNDGIIWGAATVGDQDEFRLQLETQGIYFVENAEAVSPAYTS